ncbi:hydroxyphenylacetyl-CoA thioesterase PaaI [Alkalihalobacillus sp. LMS39]|uniref:hydroxyphenylacetyl-CoA thioesterase PaaI n=1 Tax=Alkalihalobacillus sp. LMS39 TaxID=2924032 RepID=UPI001FB25F77|nr:hydroxyphenylacetyl-CoA thioesterase PaaI [Alkalihalobacillus sp. LMS39]UOE92455.1 hydroxyphenylacetyl-CoA thioesterase PaaI [Alkalihalobacillus sp. LMS39]
MREKLLEHFEKDKYAKWLGISILNFGEGFAEVAMDIKDHMLNFHGTANGGAIFSLADVAFAIASNSYGQTAVGITMTMHYMEAGAVGDHMIAVAKEDKKNQRLGLYRIEVKNEQDSLIALAEGMVYRKQDYFIT